MYEYISARDPHHGARSCVRTPPSAASLRWLSQTKERLIRAARAASLLLSLSCGGRATTSSAKPPTQLPLRTAPGAG
jgi:hypothetical protein